MNAECEILHSSFRIPHSALPARVRVLVPASTANLGPGFDCLALALGLYNAFEFTALDSDGGIEIEIEGEGTEELRKDENNLIVRAANEVWRAVEHPPVGLRIRAENNIPMGAGMGSSATAIVGGLAAANALADVPFSRSELLRLAHHIEGHPDNVAAALFGGLIIVSAAGGELMHATLDVPPMRVAIALPETQVSTKEARKALPKHVALEDAVFNVGRAAFVVRALQTGDYEMLSRAMDDRLHQPYRQRLIPGFESVVSAAREAGAWAVAISGSGPSVAAFAPDRHWGIASAMKDAFAANGVTSRIFVLPVDRQGVQINVIDSSTEEAD